ncbi:hypothetical protein BKA59DRAFT_395954 [Fusarium tricinctum]|uniref:Fungal N-terminal domain-containing protein n=1 Tax=Fusarium tricinctum TaxID=61284 RepID=A0A8K0WDN3_9HYPO|nr:hypothetical protein BKA59DRAFT_395954 [Fusarium tricinctum]
MADPVGITGTAVGIVSFGLQLYTGVSEYLDAVKGREEDLRQANTYAKTLWTSLKSIEDAMENIDSHHTIPKDAVEECKVSCEIELKSLDSLLKDLRESPVDAANRASSVKSSIRKLSYPFKKKSITKLEEKLNSTNNVLKIALLALQLALSNNTFTTMTGLQKTTDAIRTTTKNNSKVVIEQTARLEQVSQTITQSHQEIQLISQRVSAPPDSRIDEILMHLRNTEDWRSQLTGLLEYPQDLKGFCDEVSCLSRHSEPSSAVRSLQGLRSQSCIAPRRYEICRCTERRRLQRKKSRWGPIFFDNEIDIATYHAPECPLSRVLPLTERKTKAFGISIPNMLGMFKSAVHVSMSLTSGAGGLSLAQKITWTATVNIISSPSFRIINAFSRIRRTRTLENEHCELIAESCMRRLELCYAKHEASPADINTDGHSVFGGLISILIKKTSLQRIDINRWPIATLAYVFRTLAAFKVPVTHGTGRNVRFVSHVVNNDWFTEAETPLETVQALLTCCDDLMGYEFHDDLFIEPPALRLLKEFPQIAEFLGYNPLSMAILREDENDVRFLLDKFPSYNSDVNFCGQSPLHIAVQLQNISLVSLLLKYVTYDILNTTDTMKKYPIDYAILECSHEPNLDDQNPCDMSRMVELLLESNSVLFEDQLPLVFDKSCKCAKTIVLQHLAKRRKELEQLAVSHLPSAEIRSLGLCKGSVLDWNAVNVQTCLAAHHCNIPKHLMVVPVDGLDDYFEITKSVYVNIRHRETAEFAFSLGFDKKSAFFHVFQSIIWEVRNGICHKTPYSLSYVEWLVGDGTQLESVIPVDFMDKVVRPATWAHYFMAMLGQHLSWAQHHPWEYTNDGAFPPSVTAVVLSGTIRDGCLCHCSLHGCSPLSKFLQGFEWRMRYIRVNRSSWNGLQTTKLISDGLQTLISEEDLPCSWIYEAVLRFLTFSALGLRHTCCVLGNFNCDGYLDPEEINEIHEEDSAMLQLLERLMTEFQADCGRIVALGPLLRDRWLPKMTEVLEEIDSQRLTKEELRKAEDYGVIWEQEQSWESEDEDPDDLEGWMKKLDEIAPDPQRPIVNSPGS